MSWKNGILFCVGASDFHDAHPDQPRLGPGARRQGHHELRAALHRGRDAGAQLRSSPTTPRTWFISTPSKRMKKSARSQAARVGRSHPGGLGRDQNYQIRQVVAQQQLAADERVTVRGALRISKGSNSKEGRKAELSQPLSPAFLLSLEFGFFSQILSDP